MTPKEQYEARKAERNKQAESWKNTYEDREKRERLTQDALLDTLDRFVTAVERIADALEPRIDSSDWSGATGATANGPA